MSSRPEYKILSYPINAATPVYGSTPEPLIMPYRQIEQGDSSNNYIISVHNHVGTHIDAPKHFVDSGKSISDYLHDELIFKNPVIVDCETDSSTLITPDNLQPNSHKFEISDCLLLHTGYGLFRQEDKYRTHNPGIAPETVQWIRSDFPGIRCIGIDSISISSFQHRDAGREAHKAAFIELPGLGKPLLLIEDMKLDMISNDGFEEMIVLPWQIEGLDSAPCTVLAVIE